MTKAVKKEKRKFNLKLYFIKSMLYKKIDLRVRNGGRNTFYDSSMFFPQILYSNFFAKISLHNPQLRGATV